jgi:heptosyltransferase-2
VDLGMKVNVDCRFYLGNMPCKFHKHNGRLCDHCKDYQKIENRVLIVKLDALGDVLRTTSLLPPLKKKYQNSEITWITRRNAFDLLTQNPLVDKIYAVEENYLVHILNQKFDVGINLDSDLLSASILSIAKCREKLGFIADLFGRVIPANKEAQQWYMMGLNDSLKKKNRDTYQRIIYKICKLSSKVMPPQLFLTSQDEDFGKSFYERNSLSNFKRIIGINTGGGKRWAQKKWTLNSYVELIKLIKNDNQYSGIILFGGPEEVEFNHEIINQARGFLVDAGCNNSIAQFSALINLVDIFFTPDSLGMHIGVALGKTCIVLVGPTSPWELDIFDNGEILYNDRIGCVACYQSTCHKEMNCMDTIEPKLVLELMKRHW